MTKDKRAKGCPNESCVMHINKKKHVAEYIYCPMCATKMIFVCEKCFCEIEDIDPSHKKCRGCLAAEEERKQKAKETAKKVGEKAGAAAGVVGAAFAAAAQKEAIDKAAKAGAQVVKNAVDKIL